MRGEHRHYASLRPTHAPHPRPLRRRHRPCQLKPGYQPRSPLARTAGVLVTYAAPGNDRNRPSTGGPASPNTCPYGHPKGRSLAAGCRLPATGGPQGWLLGCPQGWLLGYPPRLPAAYAAPAPAPANSSSVIRSRAGSMSMPGPIVDDTATDLT